MALTTFKKDAAVNEVQYCGYVEFRRPIYQKDHTFTSGDFDLLTQSGQTGVTYFTSSQQGLWVNKDINQKLIRNFKFMSFYFGVWRNNFVVDTMQLMNNMESGV